ncbi:MAG: hypothetical protein U1F25_02505 [Rubrivivax sp.]
MPAVQALYAARVVPGWLAALEAQTRGLELGLREMAAAPACAAPLRAGARAMAANLARWEGFAKLVNASLRPAEQACFALCSAMVNTAVQMCEGDAAARHERQPHWQRTREQLATARATVSWAGGGVGPAMKPCACRTSDNPQWLQDAERALRLRDDLEISERAAVEASRAAAQGRSAAAAASAESARATGARMLALSAKDELDKRN